MRIIFHGSGGEVGRSCIELVSSNDKERYLLDAGFKVHSGNPELPMKISNISGIKGVFITHSHMDHIGALPYFHHQSLECPVIMTAMTKKLTKIMLNDSLHLELLRNHHPAYDRIDMERIMESTKTVDYYHKMRYGDLEFEFAPSGHIPGSAMILFTMEGKNILYTGDLNDIDTLLLHGTHLEFLKRHDIDAMICESTYGNREHADRGSEEKRFVDSVKRVLSGGGSVVVPSFAIGRSQELAILLSEAGIDVPIYIDGMAKEISRIMVSKDIHIRNVDSLSNALSRVEFVNDKRKRHDLLKRQCVIITTSGMVSGGPVMEYIKHVWHDSRSAIFLTGFQAEGTNGRMLKEHSSAYIDGMEVNFSCRIESFDFSGHSGKSGLLRTIKAADPKSLILNHGDPDALASLKKSCKPMIKDVLIAENGTTLDL